MSVQQKIIILLFFLPILGFSRNTISVEIQNNTSVPIEIQKTDDHCWYPNDFESNTQINSGMSKSFSSEDKASGNCYDDGAAITTDHQIDLKVDSNYGSSTFTLGIYYSFGWKGHYFYKNVKNDENLTLDVTNDGSSYLVTVGGHLVPNIISVGLGKINASISGYALNYANRKYYYPGPTSDNGYKVDVMFSNTPAICHINLNRLFEYENIACDGMTGVHPAYNKKNNAVLFLCESFSNNGACPWINKEGSGLRSEAAKALYG
ncbi:hypothetical protein [Cysteiniphilum sp. QT6929]|uniref:hypothetical protein n=1 Tax=Cysteiniphilum sp. QT6929 TaxID=2975055 RepID=UPI0024B3671A|nr:hypothetical protein [Cysteiniphilum sp. QT6929]WHN64851.1 hypothetical protein NYP54_07285 [Cysteiniphilum sp. QT6929]